jgi:hypothetical protein
MNPTALKVASAFVAGLILAFASALVYVRIQDKQQPVAAAAHAEQLPPIPQASPTTSATPDVSPSDAVHEIAPAPGVSKTKKSARTKANARAAIQVPVQVVENKPAPENPQIAPISDVTGGYPPPLSQAPPPQQVVSEAPESNASEPAPTRQPHEVEIPAGTNLAIRLGEGLSTNGNYSGDTFRGVLAQPLIWDGFIIADRGSKVLGRVVTADKAGRVHGVSELSVTLTEINTTDGQRVTVETNLVEKRGQTSTGSDTAKIAGGAALGALIGGLSGGGKGAAIGAGAGGAAGTGLVLATRGKAATLPNESQLSFQLASSVRITEKLNH